MATASSSQHGLDDKDKNKNNNNNVDGQPEGKEHDFLAEARSKPRMPISTSQSAYHHNEINLSNHGPRHRSKSGSQTADQKNAWAEKIALQ